MSELTPLLAGNNNNNNGNDAENELAEPVPEESPTWRHGVFNFLEAKTTAGRWYERFMIVLILANVAGFVLASLFVTDYNDEVWAQRHTGICDDWCDAIWFGNYADNPLGVLGIGSTSILELTTITVFSVEYLFRLYLADLENPEKYSGFTGRLKWIPTFFSMIDLISTVPFLIDAFFLREQDLVATSFVRMFRLFRMMRVEGRYGSALTMMDDVFAAQASIFGTALFVGFTTWMTISSLYYVVERTNLDMIYCGAAPDYCPEDVDTSLCNIDSWGTTDCTKAGCPPTEEYPQPCYNLYNSIPMASYYALLNLFGEFPLIDQHSAYGQVVGTLTAVVAVAVFALPAGIIGNGLEDAIASKRRNTETGPIQEHGTLTRGFEASTDSSRGRWYNFIHANTSGEAQAFDLFINSLIVLTAFTFMLDTLSDLPSHVHIVLDAFELISVSIFTVEYVIRVYSIKEDPKYNKPGGRFQYMTSFLSVVDFLSVAPYWIEVITTGRVITPYSDASSTASNAVKALRLLRILRFERYTHAFTSFDDVIMRNSDILSVTLFSALLVWVLFAAVLYITERDNPDSEMAENYKTVPHSMWLTLLNLSGEAPLAQYSTIGKVVTGILGLFATAIFGIPIGVLGAGFEEVLEEENEDNVQELEGNATDANNGPAASEPVQLGNSFERSMYQFVNGIGSKVAQYFELSIYGLIFLTIAVGCYQTLDGHENDLHQVEWVAVVIFTIEYLMRFIGTAADPQFSNGNNAIRCRLRFVVSFYSIIDLLAIVPFYVAWALPNTIVNDYDEYLRMLRILRLAKLDKYVPSLTLIDDVIRLKYQSLKVAFFAAITLWILFAAAMFLCEHSDSSNGIDNVPDYGCDSDCTMESRFQNFFDSMVYTGVHLTGDYPIIEYNWPGRFVNFFIVIAAVGVVSIPSGLIASGFVAIVQSKNKKKNSASHDAGWRAGDDWYEARFRELKGIAPPESGWGSSVDRWQVTVNEFLNGKQTTEDGPVEWTYFSYASRVFILLVIISNVVAVLVESVPDIDKAVGNQQGNFFDVFETFSVMVFASEYILRLFCAPKNREALYSSVTYATTFFGIVDFMSTAPWFVEQGLIMSGLLSQDDDMARIFRIFRIFRILQLEDFVVAFSKLDNVFRASKDVLKATGLLALIIWVGCGALFYIFEENNPNWRECDSSVPLHTNETGHPGCYDFKSTAECNQFYPDLCSQKAFTDMPNALYYTAVFLGGEWGVIDFTWPGRIVCLFLCVVGIALYAIPVGTLFDSFGAVLGLGGDDDEEEDEDTGEKAEPEKYQ
eukprot:CAMPEP_0198142330 /NCGR_PEP_ID=MMETSP1443-20131203/5137_1 /TAXON_ID=186043 /ORGANISM="Entomoneis sp., Strain CCMP2396" /LENGTH=1293 /DNA_ID=CAMNT_0043805305 /DNA_START=69 /DNA_END=3950 /DNA_ORIENTATION=+